MENYLGRLFSSISCFNAPLMVDCSVAFPAGRRPQDYSQRTLCQCIPCHVLLGFILDKHFSNCFGEKDGSDTAVCFGAFQNLNRGTAGTQRGKTSDDIFVFQGV